jgi:hypothetical protein
LEWGDFFGGTAAALGSDWGWRRRLALIGDFGGSWQNAD